MYQGANENLRLKTQLGQRHEEWQEYKEADLVFCDIKFFTELKQFETLGNNFPNGCLFRILIDASIFESAGTKDDWSRCLQVLYLSPSWEQISNISRNDIMMDVTVLRNIIHPDDQAEFFPMIYKCLIDGTLFNAEMRYYFSDTETRWLQISSKPRRDGHCVVCDGFLLDITKRREAELNLKIEKKRMRDFGNNIPNGAYFQFTVNTRTGQMSMAHISDTWTEITGIPVADTLADVANLIAAVHPDDLPHLMQLIEKSVLTLCEVNDVIRVIDKNNGKTRWIQLVSRPYRDKELVIGDGIVFDITKLKIHEIELAGNRDELELLVKERTEELIVANEELASINEELASMNEELTTLTEELVQKNNQLEDSETRMRNFIQQSLEGIIIFDDKGRIIEWNRTMENITGLAKEDAIDKYEWDIRWQFYLEEERTQQSLDDLRRSRKEFMALNGDQEPIVEVAPFKHIGSSEVRYFNGSMFPIKMKDTCHYGRIVRDITQKWLNEVELNRYRLSLEQMVEEKTRELIIAVEKSKESCRLKSSFLANMSHEVRTPLNAITGLLNILAVDIMSDDNREFIDLINKNSEQLLRLIDDILDIAKMEAGQMTIRPEPVDINKLMDEMYIVFNQMLHSMEKSYISLEIVKDADFDNCTAYTDPVRLRQIIQNLLSNAVKFTEYGYIRFGYRLIETNMLEFFVEDTGIGIRQNQLEIIFQSFRQSELANNRRYGGTGLGLTISRNLAQLMGGDMHVTSSEGRGSRFTFTIANNFCEKV